MKPPSRLPPDATPADLARAIAHLRAQGKHAAADYLQSHLPPAHPPLPHLGADGSGQGFPQQPFSPNGAAPAGESETPPRVTGSLPASGPPSPSNPASAGSLPGKVDKAYEVFGTAKPEPHSYGCVYLPIPEPQRSRVLAMGRMIADDELADRGREIDPHCTALHGLTSDEVAPVFAILSHFRPVRIKLGKVSIFAGEEYDVVKIDVESDSLTRMHEALRELPHYAKFRDFRPHVSIANVKPGFGALYALRLGSFDGTCTCDTAILSDAADTKHVYPLGRTITVNKAMSYLNSGTGGAIVAPAAQGRPVKLKRKRRLFSRIHKALEAVGAGNFPSLTSEPAFAPTPAISDADAPDFDAEFFVFGTKAFDPSEPRDAKGEWSESPDKPAPKNPAEGMGRAELGRLAGAPADSFVQADHTPHGVSVDVTHPTFHGSLRANFATDPDGRPYIENQFVRLHQEFQHAGAGERMLRRQVDAARAAGFEYLKGKASANEGMAGYYVWPRLGYDQPVHEFPPEHRDRIAAAFPAAKSVADVMATPEGREWWREARIPLDHAVFDLSDDSRSLATLSAHEGARARTEKGFDASEPRDAKGEWTKGGGAPKQGSLFDDDGPAVEPAAAPSRPARAPKESKPVKLTDEQRDALRALSELFPDGIGHLLSKTGHIDRGKAFPEEAAQRKRIAALRSEWEATDAKIKAAGLDAEKAQKLAEADDTLNDEINERVCNDDLKIDSAESVTEDDKEEYAALDAFLEAVDELEKGPTPELDDPPDPDDYSEDDFPEEDDDPDTFDDQEELGKDAVESRKSRLAEFTKEAGEYAAETAKRSAEWRDETRNLLAAVREAAKDALAIPAKQYHAAAEKYGDEDDEYDPAAVDATLANIKTVHDNAAAILAKLK